MPEKEGEVMSQREEAKKLFDEGLSYAEISERLNIPSNMLRSWKSRYKWESVAQHKPQHQPQRNTKKATNSKQRTTSDQISAKVEIPLTDAQEMFCQIFVRQLNATMAYMKSHVGCTYNSAMSAGPRLLGNVRVRARIEQLKAEKLKTIMVGKDDIVEKHMRIAFADITNYATWGFDGSDNQFAAMPSEMVDGDLVKSVSKSDKGFRIELHDPQKSLEWLSNYFSMNPMDQHKIDYDLKKLALEENKLAIEKSVISAGSIIIPDAVWRGLMNDVYAEYLTANQPTQIFFGGSSSGKSFAILGQRVVRDVMTGKRNYLIVRKTARTLRNSSFNEIWKCISRMDLEGEFNRNKTDMIITHKASGCQILFCGLDDVEKIKSITPQVGVITDILIEEATEIEYSDYKSLVKRLRGDTGDATIIKRMTFLFNPILQDHWIYTEFFAGKWDDTKNYYADDKQLILRTTYKDNRWLTEDDIRKLEDETDKYYYDVYTLGKWGILGNLIFTNWTVEDLSKKAKTWAKYHNGLDFGFYPDPAAFVRVGYDRARKEVYIFMERGGTHLTNDILAEDIKPVIGKEVVTCDSAEPKSIQELNNYGINAVPAVKGPGSVEFGIKWLQRQKILIDVSCTQTISEIRKFKYMEDRNGNVLPKPVDRDNHFCSDALRYALEQIMVETKVV